MNNQISKNKTRLKTSIQENQGFTLIELLIVVVLVPIVSLMVFRIFMFPVKTQAKAKNFQEAHLRASMYALQKSEDEDDDFSDVPTDCSVQTEDAGLGVYSITCIVGGSDYEINGKATANIYTQKINPYGGNFQDTSPQDGYDDFTGLPTHYDECYAGWKGAEGKDSAAGAFKTSCKMGGTYVIPLFADLYTP